MAKYTSLTREECAGFLARLGFDLDHYRPLSGGAANSSFHAVTTTGIELVVTVLDNHNESTAVALGSLTEWLVHQEVETPPILHHDSLTCGPVSETKPVIIRPFIRGQQPATLTLRQVSQVGASMAAYHRLDGVATLGLPTRRLPLDWSDITSQTAPNVYDAIATAAGEFDRYDRSGSCLIHGDLFPDNMIWGQNGRLHLLDWETAAHDWGPLDLGFTLAGLAGDRPLSHGVADALVDGYTRAGGIAPSQQDLRVGARYAGAVLLFHRYHRHVLLHPDPRRFDCWTMLLPFLNSLAS